jgi:hypothetical protein
MKKYAGLLWVWVLMSIAVPALAENRAVTIDIGSIGGALDEAAVRAVRKIVGNAIARGAVDSFLVNSPRAGFPIPIEGGLSACAEAGFGASKTKFNAFVQQLRSIHPKPGTYYNLERTASCERGENNTVCAADVKTCPDGSAVSRVPPSCDFAACPDENTVCTMEAKICPDGTTVGRMPPSCEFAPCPGQ